ncbi:MAG TPA: hypothetical protein ENN33_11650 [Ignavibacteria bacterium]|nr:hypothetical protein [Ignavibacteria bacterium]
MDAKKIEIIHKIQEMRNNRMSPDFVSLTKQGYTNGLLKAMIDEGLIRFAGIFSLMDKGEQVWLQTRNITKKQKNKFMLDTCAINNLHKLGLTVVLLEDFLDKELAEFYITHIQNDELNEWDDVEERKKATLLLAKIKPIVLPTESFIVGESRLGYAKLGDGEVLNEVINRRNMEKNIRDALIAETAILNNIILVTDDGPLTKVAKDKEVRITNSKNLFDFIRGGIFNEIQ